MSTFVILDDANVTAVAADRFALVERMLVLVSASSNGRTSGLVAAYNPDSLSLVADYDTLVQVEGFAGLRQGPDGGQAPGGGTADVGARYEIMFRSGGLAIVLADGFKIEHGYSIFFRGTEEDGVPVAACNMELVRYVTQQESAVGSLHDRIAARWAADPTAAGSAAREDLEASATESSAADRPAAAESAARSEPAEEKASNRRSTPSDPGALD